MPTTTMIQTVKASKRTRTYQCKVDSETARYWRAQGKTLREIAQLIGPDISHLAVYRALRRKEEKTSAL
jgi:hypothetical protein